MFLTWLSRRFGRLARSLPVRRIGPLPSAEGTVITVSDEVIAANPERFGANVDVPDYEPWTLNTLSLNNWIADGGMEPVILRYKGTATGGSADTIENDGDPSTSAGDTIGDGFFHGAEVRVYRVEDDSVYLLRRNHVARYLASEESGFRMVLDAEGPSVQAGDIYFLTLICDDAPVDKLHPSAESVAGTDTWRVYPNWGNPNWITARRDRTSVAPSGESRTSMRVDSVAGLQGGILQFIAAPPGQHSHNAFDPSRTYRLELWLRQEGVKNGRVAAWLFPYRKKIRAEFTVSGKWARYQFTFRGPRRMLRDDFAQLNITFHGPGTVWIDDVRLFDLSQPPFAMRPQAAAAMHRYRPGSLRIWSGQTNTAWGTTLDNWISPEGGGMRFWVPGRGPTGGALFSLPTALSFARETGATPWLLVHPSFDECEWRNLIEYLAGPADSPYGARRAASGQVRPWSEEFPRIRVEYGNETWNLRFRPWTFESGTQYGRFAEYFFRAAASSPHWPAVADKIDFVLGGFILSTTPRSYGVEARHASSSASIVSSSCYLSGWDTVQIPADTHDERFEHTLLYAPWVIYHLTERQVATHRLLGRMGFPAVLATSEGGPDYEVPRRGRELDPLDELFGKSLAAGVCTLDALLYRMSRGYGPQAYHAFAVGAGWTSHTSWSSGYRPHPAWLALELRNRFASGDMVTTSVAGGPQGQLPELHNRRYRIPARAAVPMIAAYSFRDGDTYAIFVLSRLLSRPTPVTLHVPGTPAAATLHTLTGDPRHTNLESMRVAVRSRRIRRFADGYTFVMPPGSVYLFVVEMLSR